MENEEADDVELLADRVASGSGFDAVLAVFREGYFDGMYRRLRSQFDDLPVESIEDALYHAAEKCANQPAPPDNARAWMYAVARNELVDEVRRKPTTSFDPDDPEHDPGVAPSAEDDAIAAEEAMRVEAAYRTIVARVKTWQMAKLRTVMLLVLDATREELPISNADLAVLASGLLNEEMTAGAVAVLKTRGRKRLRNEFPDLFPHDN